MGTMVYEGGDEIHSKKKNADYATQRQDEEEEQIREAMEKVRLDNYKLEQNDWIQRLCNDATQ